MRKILAGFLATSMIVAVASATTFAATANAAGSFNFDLGSIAVTPTENEIPATTGTAIANGATWDIEPTKGDLIVSTPTLTYSLNLGMATLTLYNGSTVVGSTDIETNGPITTTGTIGLTNGDSTTDAVSGPKAPTDYTEADFIGALDGQEFSHFDINGKLFSGKLKKVSLGGSNYGINIQFNDAASLPAFDLVTLTFANNRPTVSPSSFGYTNPDGTRGQYHIKSGPLSTPLSFTANVVNPGSGNITANVTGNLNIADVIVCDGEGNPIPLTENPSGVDNDINDNDGVQSDSTVYFMIKDKKVNGDKSFYDDDNYYKIRVNKGDNAKMVKKVDVVYKNFKNNLYDVVQGTKNDPVAGTSGRHRFVRVDLNPNYTTDEFKITLDMRLTPTADAVDKGIAASDDELKIKDFSFYMKNIERAADNDWRVGINGMMLKPLENDWNDVTWFDEDGDVAHMKFFADSDIDSFYSKLSTKWEHADYASYFNDQDAFIFNFTGSPKLSSTSRADLEIYNPFVDEDGNETIDPSTAVIYQVIDGDLYDITDSFQYKEAENGEMAFTTRTRFLGTYIICEKAVEEAASDETVPDELTPDTTEAPEDVTPDNNAGGKQPANTGKYL